jgi:hypothetical protein
MPVFNLHAVLVVLLFGQWIAGAGSTSLLDSEPWAFISEMIEPVTSEERSILIHVLEKSHQEQFVFYIYLVINQCRGRSTYGRALASRAIGTGFDFPHLHLFCPCLSYGFIYLFSSSL